jgi:hypothetical protein
VVTRLRLVAPELEPGLDDARGGPTWAMLIAAAGVAMLTGATLAAVVLLV